MRVPLIQPVLLAFLVASGCADSDPGDPHVRPDRPSPHPDVALRLEPVVTGLEGAVHIASAPDDARLFVVEQPGRIRVVRDGVLLERPFLDIVDRVLDGGERGLLSVAFHPGYASNGWLYVNYTDSLGHTRVERFTVSATDPDLADTATAKPILYVEQPFANHNGGLVAFGPDGMLYVGMGDGGSGGDPLEAAQDLATLLGKMVRIDVDAGDPYGIPEDNPFAVGASARPEIWAIGLRNPWRYSWDVAASMLYVADVGQDSIEEVNAVPAGAAGLDYGWDVMEGSRCFEPAAGCVRDGRVLPVHEYRHDLGCAITGGYVYRGSSIPEVRGHYFFGDACARWLRSIVVKGGVATAAVDWQVEGVENRITSFGVDRDGELYLTDGSSVFRIERAEPPTSSIRADRAPLRPARRTPRD